MSRVRVLIVDDSALVRELLTKGLGLDPEIEVVGCASDPFVARDMIIERAPDVMTLDVEMPKMNGVAFLRKLMPQYPMPVVMVSALTERGGRVTMEALAAGALDFVCKPKSDVARGLGAMMEELCIKIKAAAKANLDHWKRKPGLGRIPREPIRDAGHVVVAIGASTGGTEAIREVLECFPSDMPGVVLVQHMPKGFTRVFADRLNDLCAMEVREACHGDVITPGVALLAPGGMQMRVVGPGENHIVEVREEGAVSGHQPSVNVLMRSVAHTVKQDAICAILTGMGSDGADGMVAAREAGACTIAQDEATSVVWGMPKVTCERGGADHVLPLQEIGPAILRQVAEMQKS